GLWPGDWKLTARSEKGFMDGSLRRQAIGRIHIPSDATEVTLDLDFHVGNLTFTVRSAHPGDSFSATLLYADGSEFIKYPIGQDGVFRFQRLQPGTYRLRIDDLRGNKLRDEPIDLKADREVVMDL